MGGEKTNDHYQRFVDAVRAALGWDVPPAGEGPDEAAILGEIERLRDAAGEAGRPLREMEQMVVALVNQVGGDIPALWLITRAGAYETHHQEQGQPWSSAIVEQPARSLSFLMDHDQAREIIDNLSRYLGSGEGP